MFSFWTILFLIFGFYLLIKSAQVLVSGAAGLGKKYKVPKLVIGLTLVAFATSAPEGTVSVIAALQGSTGLSIGNIIGSNLANVALVLGLAAVLKTIPVSKNTMVKGIPLNILALMILVVLGFDAFFQNHTVTFNRFSLGDGLILLSCFIVFLYYIFGDLNSTQVQEEEIEKQERSNYKQTWWFLGLMIIGGLAGLMVGGKLVVDQSVLIARFFGLSEAVIGLTIVALGTSLPELSTSVVAMMKNEKDIAIGNIVGSNALNIFLVLGVTSIISQPAFDPILLFDTAYALFVTVVFYLLLIRFRRLDRIGGYVLLSLYLVYLISLTSREVLSAVLPI